MVNFHAEITSTNIAEPVPGPRAQAFTEKCTIAKVDIQKQVLTKLITDINFGPQAFIEKHVT
jgi:hypothetical protein